MKTPEQYERIIKKLIFSNFQTEYANDGMCRVNLRYGLFNVSGTFSEQTTLAVIKDYFFKKIMDEIEGKE